MSTARKIGIAIAIVLAGGMSYYALSPLFRNVRADDPLPASSAVTEPRDMSAQESSMPDAAPPDEPVAALGAAPAPVHDTFAHPASGTVRIVEADGTRYVRYEDYKTINGPDIFVYLATDTNATDFVNLGMVKATEGNINYEIPADVDLSKYRYVLTWCRMFGVLFNYAELAEA